MNLFYITPHAGQKLSRAAQIGRVFRGRIETEVAQGEGEHFLAAVGDRDPQSAKAATRSGWNTTSRNSGGSAPSFAFAWSTSKARPSVIPVGDGILIARIGGGEPRHDLRPQIAEIIQFRPVELAQCAGGDQRPQRRPRNDENVVVAGRAQPLFKGVLGGIGVVNDPDPGRGGEFVEDRAVEKSPQPRRLRIRGSAIAFAANAARPKAKAIRPMRKYPGRRRTSLMGAGLPSWAQDFPHGGWIAPPIKSHRWRRMSRRIFSHRPL